MSKPSAGFAEELPQQFPTAQLPPGPCGSSSPSRPRSWRRNEGSLTNMLFAARRFPSLPGEKEGWRGHSQVGDSSDSLLRLKGLHRNAMSPSLLPTEVAHWQRIPIPKPHRIEHADSLAAGKQLFFSPVLLLVSNRTKILQKATFYLLPQGAKISSSTSESCVIAQNVSTLTPSVIRALISRI